MKRLHQSNLKKTAHKCINVKINIIMKKKQLILTLILGPISSGKNLPKHLINYCRNFEHFLKTDYENHSFKAYNE